MKKKTTYIILTALLVLLTGVYAINSYVYKAHRDIASENIDFEMAAIELRDIMGNSKHATKYIDKVIKISGVVTAVEQNSILIDNKIQVIFIDNGVNNLFKKSTVIIKGRCVGYDDLLEIVKIDQATLINQSN